MKMCNVSTRHKKIKKEKKKKKRETIENHKNGTHTHTHKKRLILLNESGFPTKGAQSMNCEQPHDDPEAYLTEAVWLKPWH